MTVVIVGFPSSFKVPGGYGEVKYGAGAISASDIPLELLLVGMKTSAGTATADSDVLQVGSLDDARSFFGPGSQLARMCMAAFAVSGVTIFAAPVAEPGGSVQAAATITIAGTWSAAGSFDYTIGGIDFNGTVGATDTVTQVAASIVAAINANTDAPFTATNLAGVVTVVCKNVGIQGNSYILHQDTSQLPTGCTSTLGGGGASVNGGGVFFATGTGTENVTNVLAVLFAVEYQRMAIAQNDATNLGRWKTQLGSQSAPLEGKWDQFLAYATVGTFSAAQSLAQTTLNQAQMQAVWALNAQSHPSEIAAVWMALRTAGESADPDAAYDGTVLPGIVPAKSKLDWPSTTTQNTALNNGVSPIKYSPTEAIMVRSITTHCLNGSTPDYRTIDTSDAVVPAFGLRDLLLLWDTEYKEANPRVRDNPTPEEPPVPDGVATPDGWNNVVEAHLRKLERGDGFPFPIITNVSEHLPVSSYDASARRIMSAVDFVPAANQHQIGISARQFTK